MSTTVSLSPVDLDAEALKKKIEGIEGVASCWYEAIAGVLYFHVDMSLSGSLTEQDLLQRIRAIVGSAVAVVIVGTPASTNDNDGPP